MNRFFRSAFFPLIVIVLLVWLASQTLIPKHSHTAQRTYSQLQQDIRQNPSGFESILSNALLRSEILSVREPMMLAT